MSHPEQPAGQPQQPAAALPIDWAQVDQLCITLRLDPSTLQLRAIRPSISTDGECVKLIPGRGGLPDAQAVRTRADELNRSGFNLYFAPLGGPSDADVEQAEATTGAPQGHLLFAEWDAHDGFDAQIDHLRKLCHPADGSQGLPVPTLLLTSGGKSVHAYWRLDAPMAVGLKAAPGQWRTTMARLLAHCQSDSSCRNPSRIMRLPGTNYWSATDTSGPTGRAALVPDVPPGIAAADTFTTVLPPLEAQQQAGALRPDLVALRQAIRSIKQSAAGLLRPDTPADVQEALMAIPPRVPGSGTYEWFRNLAWSLQLVLDEMGEPNPRAAAIGLMEAHSPVGTDWERQVFNLPGGKPTSITAASFWYLAKREGGYENKRAVPQQQVQQQQVQRTATQQVQQLADAATDPDAATELRDAAQQLQQATLRAASIDLRQVFPPCLANTLITYANTIPFDPAALILPTLTTAASVIGRRVQFEAHGWRQPAVIWGMTVAPAGDLKSPGQAPFAKALAQWQAEIKQEHAQAQARWEQLKAAEAERQLAKACDAFNAEHGRDPGKGDMADLRKRAALAVVPALIEQGEREPNSMCRQLFFMDATIEALGRALVQPDTHGGVMQMDELRVWLDSFSPRGRNPTSRPNWLSLYDGGLLKVDRVSSEQLFIRSTAVSVIGGIQDDVLAHLRKVEQKHTDVADGDGLWSRLLLVCPISMRYNPRPGGMPTDQLLALLKTLDAALPDLDLTNPAVRPIDMSLTPEADAYLIGVHQKWWDWKDADSKNRKERSQWISKLRGVSLRLAGILELIHWAEHRRSTAGWGDPGPTDRLPQIGLERAQQAAWLSEWFLAQYDASRPAVGGDSGMPDVLAKLQHQVGLAKHRGKPVSISAAKKMGIPFRSENGNRPTDEQVMAVFQAAVAAGIGSMVEVRGKPAWQPPA